MCMAMGAPMNMGQGAGTQSGNAWQTMQYTAANAPPDPTTVPMPTARPQIDPQTSKVEGPSDNYADNPPAERGLPYDRPSERPPVSAREAMTNIRGGPVNATNLDVEYDKDGLPIRRKKGR